MHAPRLKEILYPENAKMAVILLCEQIQNSRPRILPDLQGVEEIAAAQGDECRQPDQVGP
jgi:hypothetical protein